MLLIESLERRLQLAVFVDSGAAGPIHDGQSWATAFTDLQQALAGSDGEVRIAGGIYKPSASDRAASFVLFNGAELKGGYAGSAGANPNSRDINKFKTIISGNIGAAASSSDNSLTILSSAPDSFDNSYHLDGLTISDGLLGFSLVGAGANVSNCVFTTNLGGAISADEGSSLTITNSTFTANASAIGGAIVSSASSTSIVNCAFSNNRSPVTGNGGAIALVGGFPQTLSIDRCTFVNNFAGNGGAIYNEGVIPTLTNSLFVNNQARAGTTKGDGGAIFSHDAGVIAINCTFAGNRANGSGGAVRNSGFDSSTLANCIVWNNSAPLEPEISNADKSNDVSYSDVQGGYPGTGNIDIDPRFVRNPNSAKNDPGDLRLASSSPAIDAGLNAAVPVGILTDRTGKPRFIDVPGVHDPFGITDMGAFERAGAPAGGSISGDVFADPDGSPLIATVYADGNNNNRLDNNEPRTMTDETGAYQLAGLPTGSYVVRQVVRPGWVQTTPASGLGINLALVSGQNVSGNDFAAGIKPNRGLISGFVFDDIIASGDFVEQPYQLNVPGRTVYVDLDNDKLLDANEPRAVTDAKGEYMIANVPPGDRIVRQIVPSGWRQTSPAHDFGAHRIVTGGMENTFVLFGTRAIVTGTGSIAGTVFHDFNRNGVMDGSDTALVAALVYIDLDDDQTLDSNEPRVLADDTGGYMLSGLGRGTYIVRIVPPNAYVQTTPAQNMGLRVSLRSGQAVIGKNFGADN